MKWDGFNECVQMLKVTPFVGVWIEIYEEFIYELREEVTPFVGVWIEISRYPLSFLFSFRHSLRGSVD